MDRDTLVQRFMSQQNEIDNLKLKLTITTEDEERAVRAADRLTENVAQLQREKEGLLKSLELAGISNERLGNILDDVDESRKIELPREVAEALTAVRASSSIESIVFNCFQVMQLSVNGAILRDYAADNFDAFLAALVNGYTASDKSEIDPTLKVRIRERLVGALVDSGVECPMALGKFADLLAIAVEEVLPEQSTT